MSSSDLSLAAVALVLSTTSWAAGFIPSTGTGVVVISQEKVSGSGESLMVE
jgi:hypothetical protein